MSKADQDDRISGFLALVILTRPSVTINWWRLEIDIVMNDDDKSL